MSKYIIEEIELVASELKVRYKLLFSEKAFFLYKELQKKYGKSNSDIYFLWEVLENEISVYNPTAIKDIALLDFKGEVIVLVGDNISVYGIIFDDLVVASKVLWECTGFTVYLTNNKSSYLLAINDHDMLMACGNQKKKILGLVE